MPIAESVAPTPQKPLRLWPGVVAAVLLCVVRFVVPTVVPDSLFVAMMGSALGSLTILVWWVFLSRAPWSERLGALVLMFAALFATKRFVHESIAGAGMGVLLYFMAIPVMSLALVAWAVASRRLSSGPRRASMVAAILLACGAFTLVRTGGSTSDVIGSELHWRWTPTPEQRLLAHAAEEPPGPPSAPAAAETPKVETPREPPVAKAGHEPAALPAIDRQGRSGHSGRGREGGRLAGLSRTPARQRHSRRADRDGLVEVAAGRALAAADRAGLVLVRGPRRRPLYPGAAR
jgi:hypothetical protein